MVISLARVGASTTTSFKVQNSTPEASIGAYQNLTVMPLPIVSMHLLAVPQNLCEKSRIAGLAKEQSRLALAIGHDCSSDMSSRNGSRVGMLQQFRECAHQ